jgi:hypothetical protein
MTGSGERVTTATATGLRWRDRTLLLVAVAACVAAPLAVALDAPARVRFGWVLLLFCVAPGAAIVPFLRSLDIGLVLGTSLGVVVVSAQLMLWLHLWHPEHATYVLAFACLPLVIVHLVRLMSIPTVDVEVVVDQAPHDRTE